MKKKFLRVLLLLSLFPSIGLIPSVYVDYQDSESDECSDFFGIADPINTLDVIPGTQPSAFSNVIPGGNIFQSHYLAEFRLRPFMSAPFVSVPLLCFFQPYHCSPFKKM